MFYQHPGFCPPRPHFRPPPPIGGGMTPMTPPVDLPKIQADPNCFKCNGTGYKYKYEKDKWKPCKRCTRGQGVGLLEGIMVAMDIMVIMGVIMEVVVAGNGDIADHFISLFIQIK